MAGSGKGEVAIDFCRCSIIHPCDASAVGRRVGVGVAVCVLRHKRPRPARTLNCRRLKSLGGEGRAKWPSRMPHKCSQTRRKRDTKKDNHTKRGHLPVDLVGGNHIGGLVVLGGRVAAHGVCVYNGITRFLYSR